MSELNAHDYCEAIEQQERLNRELSPTILIQEDNSPLISLKSVGFDLIYEPSIKKDYAYLVREAIVGKVGRISEALSKQNKTLIIRSVWRSFEHQRMIWDNKVDFMKRSHPTMPLEEINEKVAYFIAPPTESMHATGGAVDALIYDRKTDRVLDFGTNDGLNIDLNTKCYPYHPEITNEAKENRKLLIDLFLEENFTVDITEYWHFDFGNASWAVNKKVNQAKYDVVGQRQN